MSFLIRQALIKNCVSGKWNWKCDGMRSCGGWIHDGIFAVASVFFHHFAIKQKLWKWQQQKFCFWE